MMNEARPEYNAATQVPFRTNVADGHPFLPPFGPYWAPTIRGVDKRIMNNGKNMPDLNGQYLPHEEFFRGTSHFIVEDNEF